MNTRIMTALIVLFALLLSTRVIHAQTYGGTATTTINVLHPLNGTIIDQRTFSNTVLVFIDNSVPGETNPKNLVVAPSINEVGLEGQLSLSSAIRFDGFLAQYWTLQITGSTITGTLVEDHREEALAANLLNSLDLNLLPAGLRFVTSLAVAEGTALSGTLTNGQISLTVQGNTVDTFHPFTTTISAFRQ
jgi:hypothetical protein